MPHLTVEYTSNIRGLGTAAALRVLNEALMSTGQFDEIDIKSRAVQLDSFAVGTSPDARGFVHVKLAVLDGRPPEVKRALSESLLTCLRTLYQPVAGCHVQLCVEILDIERSTYSKVAVGS